MAKSDRGFASMPKSRVKEIAAKGGRASGKARRKKKKQEEDKDDQQDTSQAKGYARMTIDEIEDLT